MKAMRHRRGTPVEPRRTRRVEQRLRSNHVGADERGRSGDGAIDVRLGGEVHDRIDCMRLEGAAHPFEIADVAVDEPDAPAAAQSFDAGEIARIGQRIENCHATVRLSRAPMPGEIRADESGTTGDQDAVSHVAPAA